MNSIRQAQVYCINCEQETPYEFAYAGRLLAWTRCTRCGATIQAGGAFREAYFKDLRHRVQTKPGRMLRRATRHPLKFTRSLPRSVATKPLKLLEEFYVVESHRDREPH